MGLETKRFGLWASLGVRAKILISFALIMVLGGAVTVGTLWTLRNEMRSFREVADLGRTVNLIHDLNLNVKTMVDAPTDYLGTAAQDNREGYRQAKSRVLALLQEARAAALTPDEKRLLEAFGGLVDPLTGVSESILAVPDPVGNPVAMGYMDRLDPVWSQADAVLAELGDAVTARQEGLVEGVARRQAAAMVVLLGVALATVVVSLALALVLSGNITAPLREAALAVQRIAAGDLTGERVPVRGSDESGRLAAAVNQMTAPCTK